MKNKKLLLVFAAIPLFGIGLISGLSSSSEVKAESKFNGNKKHINDYSYVASNEPQYSKQNTYQFNTMSAVATFASNRGEGVTVAVIDTGANIYHEDFLKPEAQGKTINASNVEQYSILNPKSCKIYDNSTNENDVGYYTSNVVTEVGILKCLDTDTYDSEYKDYYSHGTCTGSVIGAAANGVGGLGLASGCDLMIINCDLYDNSIDVAIRYAADNGADIISMSFGGYAETWTDSDDTKWEGDSAVATDLEDAITYAYNKGCTLFASAGNENTGSHLSYPAANKHVIGVGALAKQSKTSRASYSNWNVTKNGTILENNNCDVTAPGSVWTAGVDDANNTKNVYIEAQGTSFSCPLTAAAAALYKSANKNATPDEIEQALYDSCDDIGTSGYDATFGHGSVNVSKLLTPAGPVESISLDNTELSIGVNKSKTLNVIYNPTNATNKGVTWSSSDTSVASVNNGVVTGLKVGTTTITATSVDRVHKTTCLVTVKEVTSEEYNISFDCSASTQAATNATILSSIVADNDIVKSVSSSQVFLGDDCLKLGTRSKVGSVTLTLDDTYDISNIAINSSKYGSDTGSLKVTAGSFTNTFAPETGLDAEVSVSTNTITIETTSKRAYINSVTLTVGTGGGSVVVPVTSVDISNSDITLKVGETAQINVTVSPSNATYSKLIFDSSSPEVATVDENGVVTAVANGKTIIVVQTDASSEVMDMCFVTVTDDSAPVVKPVITVPSDFVVIKLGETKNLQATINTGGILKYQSSNEAVVSVDEEGNLTPVKTGIAKITIYSEDGKTRKVVNVTVTSSAGCSGSIIAGSSIVFTVSLLGAGLLLLKKKETIKNNYFNKG